MSRGPTLGLLAAAFIASAAMAQELGAPPAPLRQLETDCEQAAIGKSGLERSNFLDDCRRHGVHSAIVSPQSGQTARDRERKRRDCNVQADMQKLTGPPRETFLNACVGG